MFLIKGLTFEELVLGEDVNITTLRAVANSDTVPQIFIDGEHIGGSEKLSEYFRDHQLS